MSLLKTAASVEMMVGPCQSCQRQLQRKSEIVDCKNGGHKACSSCTQNQGVCNNCNLVATTKFQQEYLEKLNLPQLRQVMKAIGMPVSNDGFQTQPMIDAILDYKNNPEAAKAKIAAKTGTSNGPKVLIINKPRTNIVITDLNQKQEVSIKTPTTPKSPGSRTSWPPTSPSATTNGSFEQNGTPTAAPRKTSVNVGNYSSNSPGIDTPKGSVSQLRANFENASQTTYKPPTPTITSPTRKHPSSPLFEGKQTEEKIEKAVIEEEANHSEPDVGHFASETVDQTDSFDRSTSAEDEYQPPEETHEEPEAEIEEHHNGDDVTDSREAESEAEAEEEHREEEEEVRHEEVNGNGHLEDDLDQHQEVEGDAHEDGAASYHEEAEDLSAAAREIEQEQEEEEEKHEVEQDLAEQVRDIIEDAIDKSDDNVADQE